MAAKHLRMKQKTMKAVSNNGDDGHG